MPQQSHSLGKNLPFESLSTTHGTGLTSQQGEQLMMKGWLDADPSAPAMVINGSVPPRMPGYGLYQQVSPFNAGP